MHSSLHCLTCYIFRVLQGITSSGIIITFEISVTILYLNLIAWRRQWHPTPVLLPGESHGQRSLVGCGPWGREESDTTEWLHFHFSLSYIGEGNDNPLQCSCLENPRNEGAWWAAIYGVAQSRTQLKWLCSSNLIANHNYSCAPVTGSCEKIRMLKANQFTDGLNLLARFR